MLMEKLYRVGWRGLVSFPALSRWIETAQMRLFQVDCGLILVAYSIEKPRLQMLTESAFWNLFRDVSGLSAEIVDFGRK